MKTRNQLIAAFLTAALACAAVPTPARAQSIINGGFEAGLAGWTTANQVGSNGAFVIQSGTLSPVTGFTVPAPPGGTQAAMTDAVAGGSHVLFQDFVVPAVVVPGTSVAFSLFLGNRATAYFNPGSLDWASTNPSGQLNLNQQARIDIMTSAADAFSVAAGDVLQNLFQTDATTPLVVGYTEFQIDITSLLQAHAGETLRLRFAEVDNVFVFQMGVDNVSISVIPVPSTLILMWGGMASALGRRRRRT